LHSSGDHRPDGRDGRGDAAWEIHWVGPDQEGFFRFSEKEVFPKLDRE